MPTRSRQKLYRVLLATLCTAFLLGCRPIRTSPPDPTAEAAAFATAVQEARPTLQLVGTSWQLETFWGIPDDIFPLATLQPTLNFFVQRYGGYGGCNWFLGVYGMDETNLRLRAPAETRTLCDEPGVMEQEGTYLVALRNILTYSLADGRLVGYGGNAQPLLTFIPAEMQPIEGTVWQVGLIDESGRGRPQPVRFGSTLTLEVHDGEISGSAGCNSYAGPATFADGVVTIGAIVSTSLACSEPRGIMEQEERFLSVLQSVVSYEQAPSSLLLYNAQGQPVILFGARLPTE
jgi:heat shock protein HslJ